MKNTLKLRGKMTAAETPKGFAKILQKNLQKYGFYEKVIFSNIINVHFFQGGIPASNF